MKKGRRIRDEQKGFIFILIIIFITIILSVVFSLSLKTNKVLDSIEEDEMIRVLFVIEDDDKSFLFSNLLIYSTVSKKAAVVNIPNNVGQIFQSLGRVEKIATVYEEKGINDFSKEVEKLLNVEIPYNVVINIEQFTKLTDMIGGMRIFLASPINYVDENDVRYLLPSGVVTLDGDKIYTYLHYRVEEDTNADVQERYQNVMTAFLSGLHEKNYIIFEKENFDRYLNCMSVNLEEDE
ncbi:MAG: LCP family protein, partial [Treponema sp.]|nr:LCP family protein [Treponema sp.]